MRSRGACLIRTVGTCTKAFQAKNQIKSLRWQLQLQLLCFLWIFFFLPVLTLKSSGCSFWRGLKQGQTEAFPVKSSSGGRLVLTKTTTEENNPTARFMIRSCKDTQGWHVSLWKRSSFPALLLCLFRFRLLRSLKLSVRRPAAPTRAEVSPNRGLLSRPLVPYVLVVKSSMAAFHTHAYTARPPGSQQHRLLETPAQCRMLSRKLAAAQSRGGDQCEGNDGGMVRHVGFLCFTWRKSKSVETGIKWSWKGDMDLKKSEVLIFPVTQYKKTTMKDSKCTIEPFKKRVFLNTETLSLAVDDGNAFRGSQPVSSGAAQEENNNWFMPSLLWLHFPFFQVWP